MIVTFGSMITQIYDVALGDVKRYVVILQRLYGDGIYIIKNECKNMKVNKQKKKRNETIRRFLSKMLPCTQQVEWQKVDVRF